jgi:gamma-glutamyltranspeptidase/glutathione hydrolase
MWRTRPSCARPFRRFSTRALAGELANRIDRSRRRAIPTVAALGGDTVYLSVVDRDRMAVSLINSLFSHFGVGICTERTGIMLHNRGACFVLDPAHPNCIGPNKRPMHTIIPAMAMRDGRCHMPFGVMGAHYQPMGHAQLITNIVDYRMDVQAAIDAPRAFFVGPASVVERGMPEATIAGLEQRGHDVVVSPQPWGGAQAVQIDWERGVLMGGSDPRKDGCALGY